MRKIKYLSKPRYDLSVAMLAAVLLSSVPALAQTNTASTVADNIMSSAGSFPALINTFAYIAGIGLAVTGVFKLKQHVDNPGQAPMKDALMRLAAGGALLALPFMTSVIQGTIDAGSLSTTTFSNAFTDTFTP